MKTFVIVHSDELCKNVLVEKDEYENDLDYIGPEGYFVNAPDAKVVGEIIIHGDTSHLYTLYNSD